MVLRSAYPIVDRNRKLLGALVGGVLLNRDYSIVDTIKGTVYAMSAIKAGHGFATVFLGAVRISTNVIDKNNQRAVGTIVPRRCTTRSSVRGKTGSAGHPS
jgi:two-component system NtrC family sensor kinase